MKFASTADMREKSVINLCNGGNLGCPEDFEFDVTNGRIIALIVVVESGFLGLGKKREYIIPWDKITCFGEDAILVKLEPHELQCCYHEQGSRKKKKNQ